MSAPRERVLRLLSLLQSGRRWPAPELARALEVPDRTLRRDLDQLRGMGYPVESTRGPGGHYRLVPGASLPPLMLDDEEAVATVLGLRLAAAGGTGVGSVAEAAERAGNKLRRILPVPLRRRTGHVAEAVEIARTEHPEADLAVLNTLTRAIATRRRTTFDHDAVSGTSHRSVEPMRLIRVAGRWYLFAWDRDRDDWRTFRLDRITAPEPTPEVFRPRPLPAADLAEHLRQRFRGAETLRVSLLLHTGAREAASRLHRIDGVLEALGEDRCRYTAHVDSFAWITTVLAVTDIEFTVEDPPELRDHVRRTAERLLRAT